MLKKECKKNMKTPEALFTSFFSFACYSKVNCQRKLLCQLTLGEEVETVSLNKRSPGPFQASKDKNLFLPKGLCRATLSLSNSSEPPKKCSLINDYSWRVQSIN